MAIFHFSVKVFSRSKGRSAIAAAAYRHALRLVDDRTGLTHDFRRKRGVIHSEIIGPPDAPSWAMNRTTLWNSMERAEKRRDAQLCREFEIALPAELTDVQRLLLVQDWVTEQITSRGILADIAIHAPAGSGDNRNFHAHVMTTLRSLAGGQIGPKMRNWGSRETVVEWRRSWAACCNRHLKQAGVAARVDHRSLMAQDVDRAPTRKIGQAAVAIDRKGKRVASDRGKLNAAVIAHNWRQRHERIRAASKACRMITGEVSHFVDSGLAILLDVEDCHSSGTTTELAQGRD